MCKIFYLLIPQVVDEFEIIKQKYEEEIESFKNQLSNERQLLKRQDSKTKRRFADRDAKDVAAKEFLKSSHPDNLKLYHGTSADFSTGLVERPGAEVCNQSLTIF